MPDKTPLSIRILNQINWDSITPFDQKIDEMPATRSMGSENDENDEMIFKTSMSPKIRKFGSYARFYITDLD